MAVKRVIALDKILEELQVPQVGDSYELPRDTLVTGHLTVSETINGLTLNSPNTDDIGIGNGALTVGNASTENIAIGTDAGTMGTLSNQNIAIGKSALSSGGGSLSGNVIMGHQAALNLTSSQRNVALGLNALQYGSSCDDNIAIGEKAMTKIGLINSHGNIALGKYSLINIDAGDYNIALGVTIGNTLTTSNESILIGRNVNVISPTDDHQIVIGDAIIGYMSALADVDYSANNLTVSGPSAFAGASTNLNAGDLVLQGGTAATTGIGIGGDVVLKGGTKGTSGVNGKIQVNSDLAGTLFKTDYANWNYGFGVNSLHDYVVGLHAISSCIAIGRDTLYSQTSGSNNIAIGDGSQNARASGDYNIAIGVETGSIGNIGTGDSNVTIGDVAGYDLSSGSNNVLVGDSAGNSLNTGDDNTLLGSYIDFNSGSESRNTVVGANSGAGGMGSNDNILLGEGLDAPATDDDHQLIIGTAIIGHMDALTDIDYSAHNLTLSGPSAFAGAVTNLNAGDLVLQGGKARSNGIGIGGDVIIKGGTKGNTGTTGKVLISDAEINGLALEASTANIAIGDSALGGDVSVLTGVGNLGVGDQAISNLTSGNHNVGLGRNTLGAYYGTLTGDDNIGIGEDAGSGLAGATFRNIMIGSGTGYNTLGGDDNTVLGSNAFDNADGNHRNTILGSQAGQLISSGNDNIVIGFEAKVGLASGTHQLAIGDVINGYMSALTDIDYSANNLTMSGPSAFAAGVTNLNAGDLVLQGGTAATTGIGIGGDVIIKGGAKGDTGADGSVIIDSLLVSYDIPAPNSYNMVLGTSTTLSSITTGGYNIMLGHNAGGSITTGYDNTGMGVGTLGLLTEGDGNVSIGEGSGYSLTTGNFNTMLGAYAGDDSVATGDYNILIGYETEAPSDTTGYLALGSFDNGSIAHYTLNGYMGAFTDVDVSALEMVITGTSALPAAVTNLNAGDLVLQGGTAATTGIGIGGDVIIKGGVKGATGTEGSVAIKSQADVNLFGVSPGGDITGQYIHVDTAGRVAIGQGTNGVANNNFSVVIGKDAGDGGAGADDVAVGPQTLGHYGAGYSAGANVVIGSLAGSELTTGSGNLFFGSYAGLSMTTGGYNIMIGNDAGGNTGIGAGSNNIGIGTTTLYEIEGSGNIAVGDSAGYKMETGADNILVGERSGYRITTGTQSLFIGQRSGYNATEGTNNVGLGYYAGNLITTGSENIMIGANTQPLLNTGVHQLVIGDAISGYMSALTDIDYSANNLTMSGPSAFAAGVTNLDAGDLVLQGGTAATTGIGIGGDVIIKGGTKGTTGTEGKTSIRAQDDSILFEVEPVRGDFSGKFAQTSWDTGNIRLGWDTWATLPTGFSNIAMGWAAGLNITSGDENIAIGVEALGGGSVTALTGSTNIAIGPQAGYKLEGIAEDNVILGGYSGSNITTGLNNTIIGQQSGINITTGRDNIVLGHTVSPTSATEHHQLVIGDALVGYMSALSDVDYSAKVLTLTGPSAFNSGVTNLNAGDLVLQGGTAATTGIGIGGDVVIKGGTKGATGTEGKVSIQNQAGTVGLSVDASGNINGAYIHADYDTYLTKLGGGANPNNIGSEVAVVGAEAAALATTTFNYTAGVGAGCLGGWGNGPTTGQYNAAFGNGALYSLESGDGNTTVGNYAGGALTTGSYNILIGESVGDSGTALTTGSYNILIGPNASPIAGDADSYLNIGGSGISTIAGYMGVRTDLDISNQNITITGTSAFLNASTNLNAGDLVLQGGKAATTGIGIGGDVILRGGAKGATGTEGDVQIGTAAASKIGMYGATPVAQASAPTTALTDITHTAPSVADYALQDMTNTTPYGFVTQDEANTLLSVIANLQTRVAEMEVVLANMGATA